MTNRMLSELEIHQLIDGKLSFVAQGQIPRHNGMQLFEKEYVGKAQSSADAAINLAVRSFEEDRRAGERPYIRGLVVLTEGVNFVAVLTAALRVAPKDFSEILRDLKKGAQVRRSGWNGAGQCVYMERFADFDVSFEPCFVLLNAQGKLQPGWLPSMGDLTADDWEVLQ